MGEKRKTGIFPGIEAILDIPQLQIYQLPSREKFPLQTLSVFCHHQLNNVNITRCTVKTTAVHDRDIKILQIFVVTVTLCYFSIVTSDNCLKNSFKEVSSPKK